MKSSMLNDFALALQGGREFPAATLDKAKLCLLDFLASAYATQAFPWVQQAQDIARSNSETDTGGATIIGTTYRVSVGDAAFANAVAGHSLVRDDMHLGSVSHLGVVVIPAVLAMAEQAPVSGRQLLEAIICGYEAGGRLGSLLMDVETAKKIRPTGLIGAFAAAATGARLAGLDAAKATHALGFAANYMTGLNEWAATGSSDMYFHPGIAVRNGITAMQLAKAGAESAPGALDGKAGLFAALGKPVPRSPALPFSDEAEIGKVFFKQVPACNYAQTAAQVARLLQNKHTFDPGAIDQIKVRVPHAAAHYPGCDAKGPFKSILQARMSIQFNVASALMHGDFADAHYHDFNNRDIARLIDLIDLVIDADLTGRYPEKQGAGITLTLKDNGILDETLEDVIPAGEEEVQARFRSAAAMVLGQARTESLMDCVRNLDANGNMASLFPLLALENPA